MRILIAALSLVLATTAFAQLATRPINEDEAIRQFESRIEELKRGFDNATKRDQEAYTKRFAQLQSELIELLKELMDAKTKAADLDGAIEIRTKIQEIADLDKDPPGIESAEVEAQLEEKKSGNLKREPKTEWHFLGVNKQAINEFVFKPDGTVSSHHDYDHATWKRLDSRSILFSYGPGLPYVVFHPDGGGLMRGYNSESGRARYLREK